MSEPASTVSATVASVANKFTVAGGGAAVLGGLTTTEWLGVGGLVVGLIGMIIQILADQRKKHFERTENKRRQAEHELIQELNRLKIKGLQKGFKDAS